MVRKERGTNLTRLHKIMEGREDPRTQIVPTTLFVIVTQWLSLNLVGERENGQDTMSLFD